MSLLRMSLSGTLLILAVVVVRAITIHKLPKKVFLAFWGIAIVRLLLPISFPSAFNIFTLPNKSVPVLDSVENGIMDLTMGIFTNQQTVVEDLSTQVIHDNAPAISVLFLIWLIGALLFAGYFLVSYLRCRCEFKTSLPVQNNFVKEWLSEHLLRRTMEVRSLTGISTPLTYGLIHPVILIPKKTNWENERQLQYMLYHEYVHICHFDAISKLIAAATICIHWFNPMVWVFYVLFNRDIELACDECVVRHFGENDRAAYARTLIDMEEQRQGFAPFYSYFAKNALEERIESIMKFGKGSMWALVLALMFAAVGTATAFVADTTKLGTFHAGGNTNIRIDGNSFTEKVYNLYKMNQSSPQETTFDDLLRAATGDVQNATDPKLQLWTDYQAWKSQQPERVLPDSKGVTEENLAFLLENFTGELSIYQRMEMIDTMREMGIITEEQMKDSFGIGTFTLFVLDAEFWENPVIAAGPVGDDNMANWSSFFTGLPLMRAYDLDDIFEMVDSQLRFTGAADLADEIQGVLERVKQEV